MSKQKQCTDKLGDSESVLQRAQINFDFSDQVDSIRQRAGSKAKIAYVSGNFNVIHPGHLRIFRFASELADYLVVGVNPDSAPGVTIPADSRLHSLESISFIDHCLLLKGTSEQFIAVLKPDVVVKGKEFENRINPELEIVEAYGGRLIFSSGEMSFSSLELLEADRSVKLRPAIKQPTGYMKRHGIDPHVLKRTVDAFGDVRSLVIGDIIIDKYIDCEALGMSQEDPTVVVTPIDQKVFLGGAGVVSAHFSCLGAQSKFISIVGDDEAAEFAASELGRFNVTADVLVDDTRPTTQKERFRVENKTLLRVNKLRQHSIGQHLIDQMLDKVRSCIDEIDLLIFSDFNYGCLPQRLVDGLVDLGSQHNVMMAAESQASSQLSDVSRFSGMDLIGATEREARLALRDKESGLAVVADLLSQKTRSDNVIVTLGGEGLIVHGKKQDEQLTDRLPAFNPAPRDVAGAGDALLSAASLALCSGADIWQSAYLGSLAAALSVSTLGNAPIQAQDLLDGIVDTDFEVYGGV